MKKSKSKAKWPKVTTYRLDENAHFELITIMEERAMKTENEAVNYVLQSYRQLVSDLIVANRLVRQKEIRADELKAGIYRLNKELHWVMSMAMPFITPKNHVSAKNEEE